MDERETNDRNRTGAPAAQAVAAQPARPGERRIQLDQSWLDPLQPLFEQPFMRELRSFLIARRKAGKIIYPPAAHWFEALNLTPLPDVKVVILGQDPYHGPGQANGLCFSVEKETPLPPSLRNIFQELHSDLGIPVPAHGSLACWARQGVLLLNSVLTVEAGHAAAHAGKGWERFTDEVIALVNRQREHVVFLLWGRYAQRKAAMIDRRRHLVLEAAHPSPLSASSGFFGCRHFSQANRYLVEHGATPIDWAPRDDC